MTGLELLEAFENIDTTYIEEVIGVPKVKKSYPIKRWCAIAACLVLLISAGFGTYAYAADAKEYRDAMQFFGDYSLPTEGLSRGEIKAVYRDITNEEFAHEKTAGVIENSLTPEQKTEYEESKGSASTNNAEDLWDYKKQTSATEPIGPATDETKPVLDLRLDVDRIIDKLPRDVRYYYEKYGTYEEEQVVLDVPVYKEQDVLYTMGLGFMSWWRNDIRTNYVYYPTLNKIFFHIETNAFRIRSDGTAYAIWDTDTGYRLYVFLNPELGMFTGWPIVINKSKIPTLKEFQDIKIGDPLKKVDAIDGVAGLNEYIVVTRAGWTEEIWNKWSHRYGPLTSYHYCKDGILRIEYKEDAALEGLNFVVSKITVYEDFMVENFVFSDPLDAWMNTMPIVNQKILDIDLPW